MCLRATATTITPFCKGLKVGHRPNALARLERAPALAAMVLPSPSKKASPKPLRAPAARPPSRPQKSPQQPVKVAEASLKALADLPGSTRSAMLLAAAFSGDPEKTMQEHLHAWQTKVGAFPLHHSSSCPAAAACQSASRKHRNEVEPAVIPLVASLPLVESHTSLIQPQYAYQVAINLVAMLGQAACSSGSW